jgi:hypothetical protein
MVPEKLSAFVVSYNRAAIIGSCLRALRFADEVIVVDKTSTDDTPAIAAGLADRVISVPWSPTADETRTFAVAQCSHDWIVFVDDDECFSHEAIRFIQAERAAPRADAYAFPRRDYVLGVHDERAYYWPEHHIRWFRRGAVEFSATVHACIVPQSDRVLRIASDTGACIHHLSHRNVSQWIEKTNRYTSCADRVRVEHAGGDLIGFAHARIDHWLDRTRDASPGGYPRAVALLRATYDLIDRLKTWEEERDLDSAAAFARVCDALDAEHGALPAAASRAGVLTQGGATPREPDQVAEPAAMRARIAELRASCDATAAEAARLDAALSATTDRLRHAEQVLAAAQQRIEAIETSTSWRVTAGARRLAEQARRLARYG